MLLAISRYIKPLSEVDVHRKAHHDYIKSMFEDGKILICGRQTPPEGGVIIANILSREAFQAILADDPFSKAGVTRYQVIEFVPAFARDALRSFLD